MAIIDVRIVSHMGLPDGAPDDRLLAQDIEAHGGTVDIRGWDDPAVDWSSARTTVVRSAWTYHDKVDAWLGWIARVEGATRLRNPPAVLRMNTDKRYLLDLADCVPTVPTLVCTAADCHALPEKASAQGWCDIVVKPSIGAGASGAKRFSLPDDAIAVVDHAHRLTRTRPALAQPFMSAVLDTLERSLVFVGGAFTHAFTKPAFHRGLAVQPSPLRPFEPNPDEHAVARAALFTMVSPPAYARVDLVLADAGPTLMELELIEPDLALRLHPPASAQLARLLLSELS